MKNPYDNLAAISQMIRMQETLHNLTDPYGLQNNLAMANVLSNIAETQQNLIATLPALQVQRNQISSIQTFINNLESVKDYANKNYMLNLQNTLARQTEVLCSFKNLKPTALTQLQENLDALNFQQSNIHETLNILNNLADQIKALNIPEGFSIEDTISEMNNEEDEECSFEADQTYATKEDLEEAVAIILDKLEDKSVSNSEHKQHLQGVDTYILSASVFLLRYWDNQIFIDLLKVATLYLASYDSPEKAVQLITNLGGFISAILGAFFAFDRIAKLSDDVKMEMKE